MPQAPCVSLEWLDLSRCLLLQDVELLGSCTSLRSLNVSCCNLLQDLEGPYE